MQRKQFYLYYTLINYDTFANFGSYVMVMNIFFQNLIIISVKMEYEVFPMQSPLRFLTQRKANKNA